MSITENYDRSHENQMQDNSPASPSVLYDVLRWIAIPLASVIAAFVAYFGLRPKIKPEIGLINANRDKAEAEARALDGGTVGRAWDRIDELQGIIDALRAEQFKQGQEKVAMQRKIDDQASQIRLMENQIDTRIRVTTLPSFAGDNGEEREP